jgi:host factor-I protein
MPVSLQDGFLAQCRQDGTAVTVSMMNGLVLHGSVKGFDPFTLLLDVEGQTQLIYKHAISTISKAGNGT